MSETIISISEAVKIVETFIQDIADKADFPLKD